MLAAVWHAFGVADGSRWISTGGPSMHGIARCGQVLNVDDAYVSSSQVFIRLLFSGVQANGRVLGRVV